MKKITSFFLLFLIMTQVVEARIVLFSFEDKVKESDLIITGRMIKTKWGIISRKNITYFEVYSVIKGKLDEKTIKVESDSWWVELPFIKEDLTDFTKHRDWLLFLQRRGNNFRTLGFHQGHVPLEKDSKGYYILRAKKKIYLNELLLQIKEILGQ